MEHNRIPEDVVWEVCDAIFAREHPEASGARKLQITTVLAIPVAQGVVWRHCAKVVGEADLRPSEAPGHRKS